MDPSNFEKIINDCLKSCTGTDMSSGPMPRWQRKLQAQAIAKPLSPLVNGSDTPAKRASCITPGKVKSGVEATKKTPGNCYIEKQKCFSLYIKLTWCTVIFWLYFSAFANEINVSKNCDAL